jgi:hypothetical protein
MLGHYLQKYSKGLVLSYRWDWHFSHLKWHGRQLKPVLRICPRTALALQSNRFVDTSSKCQFLVKVPDTVTTIHNCLGLVPWLHLHLQSHCFSVTSSKCQFPVQVPETVTAINNCLELAPGLHLHLQSHCFLSLQVSVSSWYCHKCLGLALQQHL